MNNEKTMQDITNSYYKELDDKEKGRLIIESYLLTLDFGTGEITLKIPDEIIDKYSFVAGKVKVDLTDVVVK